jgi:hypothetical protein
LEYRRQKAGRFGRLFVCRKHVVRMVGGIITVAAACSLSPPPPIKLLLFSTAPCMTLRLSHRRNERPSGVMGQYGRF